jgi:hypothetical protein
MWDIVYVLITLLFFAAMLWYVVDCKWLGGSAEKDGNPEERSSAGSRRARKLP